MMMVTNFKFLVFLSLLFAGANFSYAQTDTTQQVNLLTKNSAAQQKKPYVILISADGFRHDYADKYDATHLKSFSKNGVKAESMIPSYPTVTFPNHYSIATGLYPAHHGLVNNTFYDKKKDAKYSMSAKDKVRDGSWYGGIPIWVLAEQQQMLAANMFWVGSEAAVQNVRSSYYYNYTEQITVARRIQAVKEWLKMPEERRPHLITFYVSEPDHAGHRNGPEAPETQQAVKMVDSIIFELTEAVKETGLPVNFIFLSDHGMTSVDQQNPIPTPKSIDLEKFMIPSSGTMVDIQAKNKADIQPLYEQLKKEAKDYDVYLKSEVPAALHYSAADD
ncbi:MAG: ectonucleotide pyrophosphatase/phosphodiesterase, partial [Bacteroidia bacterium]